MTSFSNAVLRLMVRAECWLRGVCFKHGRRLDEVEVDEGGTIVRYCKPCVAENEVKEAERRRREDNRIEELIRSVNDL